MIDLILYCNQVLYLLLLIIVLNSSLLQLLCTITTIINTNEKKKEPVHNWTQISKRMFWSMARAFQVQCSLE